MNLWIGSIPDLLFLKWYGVKTSKSNSLGIEDYVPGISMIHSINCNFFELKNLPNKSYTISKVEFNLPVDFALFYGIFYNQVIIINLELS